MTFELQKGSGESLPFRIRNEGEEELHHLSCNSIIKVINGAQEEKGNFNFVLTS